MVWMFYLNDFYLYICVWVLDRTRLFLSFFIARQFYPPSHCYCHEYFSSCTAGGSRMKTIQISLKSRTEREREKEWEKCELFFVLHCSITSIAFVFFVQEIKIHTMGSTIFIIHHISLELLSLRIYASINHLMTLNASFIHSFFCFYF